MNVITANFGLKAILNRQARTIPQCTNDDWWVVLEAAQDAGALPGELYYRDIIRFNRDAESFDGTIREFIENYSKAV